MNTTSNLSNVSVSIVKGSLNFNGVSAFRGEQARIAEVRDHGELGIELSLVINDQVVTAWTTSYQLERLAVSRNVAGASGCVKDGASTSNCLRIALN